MSFADIEGQEAALSVLRHGLAVGRIGQAYLLWGPSGIGKQMAAIALAKAALCTNRPGQGCEACETCRRIAQGAHPDVRIFAPRDEGNRNLQVEYLRSEILPITKFAPFEAEHAFLIFPQADVSFPVQHPEAANALLKTLEEPRPRVHFLLLSERPDRLLTTIRSRCQRVRFAPLGAQVLARILERHGVPEAARQAAIALAGGRADRAIELCADDRAQRVVDWALRVDTALGPRSPAELLELAESMAQGDDRDLALESLASYYRDVAALGLGLRPDELVFRDRADLIAARAAELPPARAAERVAKIQQVREDLESSNANPELALDGLLFGL
jgi:DNA polymerase-3 subunit delta'